MSDNLPFDGVVVKSMLVELSQRLLGGRIEKIFQPCKDEIIFAVRAHGQNPKLLISANAAAPRIHITETQKENPINPPVFCMLLRKYLLGGKIINIEFSDYERIIAIVIESLTDMKDIAKRKLVVEIMGKHSNIILLNNADKIIDSIFHVDKNTSSVREVMPARCYVPPPKQNKQNPENINFTSFFKEMEVCAQLELEKYILSNIQGFSPLLAKEICYNSDLDSKMPVAQISESDKQKLKDTLLQVSTLLMNNSFKPCVFFSDLEHNKPVDFHALEIKQSDNTKFFPSISTAIDSFYLNKENVSRYNHKKNDLIKIINRNITRVFKKVSIYQDKLTDASDTDKFRLFGELITANIYRIEPGVEQVSVVNYYTESIENIDIALDKNLSSQQNAQSYFKKYTKAKNSVIYAQEQLAHAHNELKYLESVLELLKICVIDLEIEEIKQELIEQGYVLQKNSTSIKNKLKASSPKKFVSSDGFDILVGKNNKQNDHLTFKIAYSNDVWMHTKDLPGSHVIIRKQGKEVPENTLLEAASLAAYFSKGKYSSNVPVDYTLIKNVKKTPGAKPGMVIYTNFKTIFVTPDENFVKTLKNEN